MYASREDMIAAFGEREIIELTNLEGVSEIIDDTRLDAALDYATAEIDSRIGARFIVPLPSVPLVLRNKAVDIARYQLEHGKPREDVIKRYDDAIKWLEAIVSGKVSLGDAATPLPATSSGEVIHPPVYSSNPRVFSRSTLWDY